MTTTDEYADIHERYAQERLKRIRADGNEQYVEPTGRFAHLLDDPYTPRVEREPIHRDVEVLVVGAGFSGLTTGARLRQAGIDDLLMVDGAGDVGGAWYWNRYPGAMCDTAAMVYLPLLEETGHMPTMKYVPAPEIHAHAKRIAEHFGLYERALFSTQIREMRWDDDAARWIVTTDRGDEIRARFVTIGTGPLHRPKLPGIPGLDSFGGECFHTSRWDYSITGGDPLGAPMTELAGKRVGIIGTGATAVQCIPPLGRDAGELFVFQRTPSSIDVRNNIAIDPEWFAGLGPGWQQRWLTNFATLQAGGFADEDLVQDGWTDISQRIRDRLVTLLEEDPTRQLEPALLTAAYEASDDEKMNEIRARVDAIVEDPATAEALKPWYRQLCKRPCFHDEYLQTFNRPNVHLIDTAGQGVERIDAEGVWVGGVHYPLDVLIFASGFEVGTEAKRRAGFDPVGRDGERLSEHWANGMRTLHGMHVHGFPNLFIVGPAQGSNLLSNITQNLTESGTTIAKVIGAADARGARTVEATAQAEQSWIELLLTNTGGIYGNQECTPGYYNNEGGIWTERERLGAVGYPGGPVAFWEFIDGWRNAEELEGLTLT